MIVGILTIATGKYKKFVMPLYKSISEKFLPDYEKLFILFTDAPNEMKYETLNIVKNLEIFQIERRGFPGDTLYRYHHFSSAKERLKSLGQRCPHVLFYLDADMLIFSDVGAEVLPTNHKSLIATAHPGFYERPGHNPLGSPEQNERSKAYLSNQRYRPCYWAGGFNGGEFDAFMSMSTTIAKCVDDDENRGIVAVWHDESHLNAYLSDPSMIDTVKTLNPSYCYPESWTLPFAKRIIALDKDHSEIRKD